jgi:large subunit ribosomal protein L18e
LTRKRSRRNPELLKLVGVLKSESSKNNAPIWLTIAEKLASSRRRAAAVNLSRISRFSQTSETVIVPGKVVGAGDLTHPLRVSALAFSNSAREKITRAGGEVLTIESLLKENPAGKNVKIIG